MILSTKPMTIDRYASFHKYHKANLDVSMKTLSAPGKLKLGRFVKG